jgi:hypothetical protein
MRFPEAPGFDIPAAAVDSFAIFHQTHRREKDGR